MRLPDQGVRALPFTESGQREYRDDSVRGLIVVVGNRVPEGFEVGEDAEEYVQISRKGASADVPSPSDGGVINPEGPSPVRRSGAMPKR